MKQHLMLTGTKILNLGEAQNSYEAWEKRRTNKWSMFSYHL